jgi:hypothetical protein
LGGGDGTFANQPACAVGQARWSVALSDVNGDGKSDIVTANDDSNTVSVLLGRGNGTFTDQVVYRVGPQPVAVAAGDLNGDGAIDVVVANANYGFPWVSNAGISVLLGRGDGTFAAQVPYLVGQGGPIR